MDKVRGPVTIASPEAVGHRLVQQCRARARLRWRAAGRTGAPMVWQHDQNHTRTSSTLRL